MVYDLMYTLKENFTKTFIKVKNNAKKSEMLISVLEVTVKLLG